MGYTGHIILNGNIILQEWKSSNTYFGQYYATAYLRQLGCELNLSSIYKTIGHMYNSRFDEVGKADRQITYSTKLINILREIVSNQYMWDNNEIFDGETFVGEYDRVGLAGYIKSKQTPNEIDRKRPFFLESQFFFEAAFADETIGTQYYNDFVNIKRFSKLYFIEMIELLYSKQEESFKIFAPSRKKDKEMISILKGWAKDIEDGDTLRIRFSPTQKNLLQIFSMNKKTTIDIPVEDEYVYYNLFEKNNLYCLGAYCKLTSKKELGLLIDAFDKVKKRNKSIEQYLIDCYNSITDEDDILVDISGSF